MTDFRLDPALKTQWIEALRSGKYPLGTAALCETVDGVTKYCALGVFAAMLNRLDSEGYFITKDGTRGSSASLAGFDSSFCDEEDESAEFMPLDVQWDVSEVNDIMESFDEVADYIEKEL